MDARILKLAKGGRKPAQKRPKFGPDAEVAAVLSRALATPDDIALWRKVFLLARDHGEFDIAQKAARMLGDDAAPAQAEIAIARGNPDEAIVLLKDRSDARSRSLLAWTYFCMNKHRQAAELWNASINAEENLLGRTIAALSLTSAPLETISALRRLSGSSERIIASAAAKLLAEFFSRGIDHQKALTWARRAEWLMPFDISVKRLVAIAAEKSGQRPLALERWTAVLSRVPEDAQAHEMLGRAALERKDSARAADHFRRALVSDPLRANLRVLLGDMAHDGGNQASALDHWETAHRVDPKDREALLRLAEFSWDEGDLEQALDLYLKLRKLGFSDDEEEEQTEIIAYLYSEILLGGEKKTVKSSHIFFNEALKKFPKNPLLLVYRARCHLAFEEYAPARDFIRHALEIAPMLPEGLFEMGNLLLIEGRREEGMTLLLKAGQLDPDPFYKKEIARNFSEIDDWVQAERWYKKALASGSDEEEILLGLYLSLFNQKKYPAAENTLRRALALFPENLQIKAYLAETLMLLGKFDEAYALLLNVQETVSKHEQGFEETDDPEYTIDPPGVLEWLLGFACAFRGGYVAANACFEAGRSIAPHLAEWFGDLSLSLRNRLGKKARSVIIFTD